MIFDYGHIKEPIVVRDDKVFVQKTYFDYAKFHPRHLLFLNLDSPELKKIGGKDIFLPHHKMTQDYIAYQKLKKEKEKILPLLRMTLLDETIPDINFFPLKYSINS